MISPTAQAQKRPEPGVPAVVAPDEVRSRRRFRIPDGGIATRSGLHVLGIAVLLGAWELAGLFKLAGGFVITPRAALHPLFAAGDRQLYIRAAQATFAEALRGLLYGGVLAMLAALVADQIPRLRRHVERMAALANSAPWVAIGPVVLVVAGRNTGPVAIAAIAVFFYIFVATSVGLGAAPASMRELFDSSGAGRGSRLLLLQIPRALPVLMEGLKLAAPTAIAAAIYGEWYGSSRGLGLLLISAMQSGQAVNLWAASVVAAGGGLAAYLVAAGVQSLLRRRYGSGIAGAQTTGTPIGRSHGARHVVVTSGEVLLLAGILIGIWQLWISAKHISPLIVPNPSSVLSDLVTHPSSYLASSGHTLATAAIALLLGALAGVVLAATTGVNRIAAGVLVPGMVLLAATPLVALFPLLSRVFGYNPNTIIAIAAVTVVLPVFVYTRSGLDAALASHIEMVRSHSGGRREVFFQTIVPSALPHVATGVRVAAGSSIIASVVAESLIGVHGLGVDFTYAYRLFDMPRAFGSALMIVVLSLIVFAAFGRVEAAVHRRFTTHL